MKRHVGCFFSAVLLFFANVPLSSRLSLPDVSVGVGSSSSIEIIDGVEENRKNEQKETVYEPICSTGKCSTDIIRPFDPVPLQNTISGMLQWNDQSGVVYPLIGARVEVVFPDETSSKVCFTTKTGNFSVYCPDKWEQIQTNNYYLKVQLSSYLIEIQDGDDLVFSTDVSSDCLSGIDSKVLNLTFPYNFVNELNQNFGEAVHCFEGLELYAEHAKELMRGKTISKCSAKLYPNNLEKRVYYNKDSRTIFLAINDYICRSKQIYDDWDTLGHEYTHHLQQQFDLATYLTYDHYYQKDDCQHLKEKGLDLRKAKKDGLELAWAEGFACYYSLVAQKSFPAAFQKTGNPFGVDGPVFFPSNYTDSGLSVKHGTKPFLYAGGETTEIAITGFLYNLIDEQIVDEQAVWDELMEDKAHCFSVFYTMMFASTLINGVEELLEYFGFVPTIVSVIQGLTTMDGVEMPPSIRFKFLASRSEEPYFKPDTYRVTVFAIDGSLLSSICVKANGETIPISNEMYYAARYTGAYIVIGAFCTSGYKEDSSLLTGAYYSRKYNAKEFTYAE